MAKKIAARTIIMMTALALASRDVICYDKKAVINQDTGSRIMGNANDLDSRINAQYKNMSKGQKLLAAYITDHYDTAAFLTAARLGAAVGVSESTVVRFALRLGYKGYPEFQKELAGQIRDRLSAVQKIEDASGQPKQDKILEAVLTADIQNIQDTLGQIDEQAFLLAADMIGKARNIYIIGLRSCAPLAGFLAFYFNLLMDGVRLLQTSSISELFEQMLRIDGSDVMIAISFPRYSMRTLKAIEFANHRNAKVITLTDSIHSPMNLYSSCNLIAKSGMASVADSLVAPLSVINALIAAVGMKKQKKVVQTLESLERIWEEYQVYGSDEIDRLDDGIRLRCQAKGDTE